MIAIQKIGKSFLGALNYNLKKLYHSDPDMQAELLDSNFLSMDFNLIRQELKLVRSLRPTLNRYVYHTSLNFSKEDILDNEKLLAIARDYLQESGYTNNQYMIFRHYDAGHPHIHLLVNRITFDGEVVSDSNNYKKSEAILRKLEDQYNLVSVEQSSKVSQKAATKDELEMVLRTGKASDKMLLQEKMKAIIKRSGNIRDFIIEGEQAGIHFLFNQATTGRVSGITYFHDGFKIKGQALGNVFKWAEIIKQVDYEQAGDSQAISEANDRTTAKYGKQTAREVTGEQRTGGSAVVPGDLATGAIEYGIVEAATGGNTSNGKTTGGENGSYSAGTLETGQAANPLADGSASSQHNSAVGLNIQIVDDEDDAKRRRRRGMQR